MSFLLPFTNCPSFCIRYNEAKGNISLIDLEYSRYTVRGFDWGNHFNAWAGRECDWSNYPRKSQQNAFLRAYRRRHVDLRKTTVSVEAMRVEARIYGLVSHVYWALWAILQAQMSNLDFDFLEYAEARLTRWRQEEHDVMRRAGLIPDKDWENYYGEACSDPLGCE